MFARRWFFVNDSRTTGAIDACPHDTSPEMVQMSPWMTIFPFPHLIYIYILHMYKVVFHYTMIPVSVKSILFDSPVGLMLKHGGRTPPPEPSHLAQRGSRTGDGCGEVGLRVPRFDQGCRGSRATAGALTAGRTNSVNSSRCDALIEVF